MGQLQVNDAYVEKPTDSESLFEEVSVRDLINQEEDLGISNFCKINQRCIGQSNLKHGCFVIGPQFN